MKKFTKMLALGLAAALTFGMTVSAAPSKDTIDNVEDAVNVIIDEAGVQDANGNKLENPPKVEAVKLPETVYSEAFGKNYDEACSKAINSPAVSPKIDAVFAEVFPGVSTDRMELYSDIIDISVKEGDIPAGGLYVPVWLAGDSEAYVVAHWNGQSWEVLQTKVENGVVYALFTTGFSPVSLTIVTVGEEKPGNDNEKPNDDDNNNSSDNSDDKTSAPSSPKTGETMPVAGILAVICLAGAAVCAKKVRYNR